MDILALGAAIGKSQRDNSASATGWLGILIDINGCPAVMLEGIHFFGGRRIVMGHGISLSIIVFSISLVIKAYFEICCFLATCEIIGLSCGLFFNWKILAIAFGSNAFAPNPYTVSVGKATSHPVWRISFACKKFSLFA